MNKQKIIFALFFIAIFASLSFVSALTISNVDYPKITPGKEGEIIVSIKNSFDEKVEDVSLSLIFKGTSFAPVGSSESSVEDIRSDDEESLSFNIRALSDIKPGDYEIPYLLSYKLSDVRKEQSGTIGVRVSGEPEITFSVSAENPIIGQNGKVSLKIVNKGFGDAKFVSVRASSGNGFTLLSEEEVYIGNVDSDDFETATYNVIFNSKGASFNGVLEYKNSDGSIIRKTISLPVSTYTSDEAISLGIIKKSNAGLYAGIVILVIIIWFVWRAIKKSRRLKKSREMQNNGSAK